MRAVEFDSRIEDGTITIPGQYRDAFSSDVRVIVLAKENPVSPKNKPVWTGGHFTVDSFAPLSREEAHAR
jgi:hypothetical protein